MLHTYLTHSMFFIHCFLSKNLRVSGKTPHYLCLLHHPCQLFYHCAQLAILYSRDHQSNCSFLNLKILSVAPITPCHMLLPLSRILCPTYFIQRTTPTHTSRFNTDNTCSGKVFLTPFSFIYKN